MPEPNTSVAAFAARPNPFVAGTDISLPLGIGAPVSVRIVDIRGREIARIAAGDLASGAHALHWDGCETSGRPAVPGLYFVEVAAGGRTVSRGKLLRVAAE